jgi:uncharacterized protein YndB with AHSA1/START domain
MYRVHVTQDFRQPPAEVYAYLAEHENLGPVFGAKITRVNDGTDGTRNGVGSARDLRIGPLPSFTETVVEAIPDQLIRYRITRGGVLKDHEGVMRFEPQGAGTHLDYTITFDGKAPGIGPFVRAMLTRGVSKALRDLAQRPSL